MNILIIGNGFDLAHGLPTKYTDFLEFVKRIKVILNYKNKHRHHKFRKEYLDDWQINSEVKSYLGKILKDRLEENIVSELYNLIKNNFWLDYFIESKNYIDQGWIDFEKEISEKIQDIDYLWKNNLGESTIVNGKQVNINIYNNFLECVSKIGVEDVYSEKDFEFIRNKLLNDLERMIRCLEIYLSDCVAAIPYKSILEDIEQIKFDKILSFNYTDTYRSLYASYDENLEYDFIHGKAEILNNVDSNNMVLGIDEYLTGESVSKEINFIAFKKYYQRIHKETGCKYKNWIEQIQNNSIDKHNIYIFGHSLDITDGDVLREMILNENVTTTIFYYDKNTYGSQIKNLVQVISRDQLIQRVYGEHRSIVFKKQKDPIKTLPKNTELQKDLKNLENIHMLSNKKVRDLVHKVHSRIKDRDTFYISNVEDLMVLYAEVIHIPLFETLEQQHFIDIAKQLVNYTRGNVINLNCKKICKFYNDRVEALYDIIVALYKTTNRRYTKEELNTILQEKNANKLVEFCEHYTVTEISQLEEILKVMINKFNNPNINAKKLYEQILRILSASETHLIKELLERQINNESDSLIKARLLFLYNSLNNM